ncbi:hypothetical protein D3C80_1881170 [compost metagenome]
MQLLDVDTALPCIEIVKPLDRPVERSFAKARQALFQNEGAAARSSPKNAKSVSGQLAPIVLPSSNAQI